MTKIYNGTPHQINLIDRKSCTTRPEIRKIVSDAPVITATIPSHGMLNVQFEQEYDGAEETEYGHIEFSNKTVKHANPIPDGFDIVIVSGLYASAVDDPRLYTVIDPVYDTEGKRVIGCIYIGKVVKKT